MIVETIAFEVFPFVWTITFGNSNIKRLCSNNVVKNIWFCHSWIPLFKNILVSWKAEKLTCLHKENNALDVSATKTCKEDGYDCRSSATWAFSNSKVHIRQRGKDWLFSHRVATENHRWFKEGWKFLAKWQWKRRRL